ncbi:MAG: hypothetical protein IJQ66_05015 [Clostridia bacterium]|nr:hypothetical protein [Clostridia bacterium]
MRTAYSYFFGISYGFDGLTIKHCLPKEFGDCSAEFTYIDKKFTLIYKRTDKLLKVVKFNGDEWTKTVYSEEYGKVFPFFADEDMQDENIIEIEY